MSKSNVILQGVALWLKAFSLVKSAASPNPHINNEAVQKRVLTSDCLVLLSKQEALTWIIMCVNTRFICQSSSFCLVFLLVIYCHFN